MTPSVNHRSSGDLRRSAVHAPRLLVIPLLTVVMSGCGGGGSSTAANSASSSSGSSSSSSSSGGPAGYSIGGFVSGLVSGNSIALLDNGADALSIGANDSFAFGTQLSSGTSYAVTISAQPRGETCTIADGSGQVTSTNITSVIVTCGIPLTWTWIDGYNLLELDSIEPSFPVLTNKPGLLAWASSWTDSVGNLWLFGGIGSDSAGTYGDLNVLWKYNPNPGGWTRISGSAGAAGVYGVQGVPSASNNPGARASATSWTDAAGNFWLFGGTTGNAFSDYEPPDLNDLWEYNPKVGTWTWVSGANTVNAPGVYGTQGTASTGNVPGARNSATSWIDSAGNLWLFGGIGYDSMDAFGSLNDLWKYSPTLGTWTWVSGANVVNAPGAYGIQGTASVNNAPGARNSAASWTDSEGNLWLFGGNGGSDGLEFYTKNDLWEFSPNAGTWVWVNGSNSGGASGVYGTQGTGSAGNIPGARASTVSWTDSAGNFWLFGGVGFDSTGANGELNDQWKYSPSAGTWTWVNGSNLINSPGAYGVMGTPSSTNVPSARDSASSWLDSAGNLWLFGGQGSIPVPNDLWRFTP